MSKADEMFEKLGYYGVYKSDSKDGYYQYDENEKIELIVFLKDKKAVAVRYDACNAPAIEMQELQAINEKVKELRLDRRRR